MHLALGFICACRLLLGLYYPSGPDMQSAGALKVAVFKKKLASACGSASASADFMCFRRGVLLVCAKADAVRSLEDPK